MPTTPPEDPTAEAGDEGSASEGRLSAADRELLTAMGNCYDVCGADFEDTVRMVARGRDFTRAEAKERLARLRRELADDPEYRRLRSRLPEEFPC